MLNGWGAQIGGVGSNTLTIHGVDRLGGGDFTISPDYLEVGSFMGLGAVTAGEIRIHGVAPDHMRMINFVFADRLGVRMRFDGNVLIVPTSRSCPSARMSAVRCRRSTTRRGRNSRPT